MILLALLVMLALLALAVYFLPWWSWLIILPGGTLALWLARGRIMLYLFTIPFRMKGRVLRNAATTVHAVRKIPKPDFHTHQGAGDEPGDEREVGSDADGEGDLNEPVAPRVWFQYYEIEVTITPKAPSGPFQLWAPYDLQMIPPRTNPQNDFSDVCEVLEVTIHKPIPSTTAGDDYGDQVSPDDASTIDEASKFSGPLRLTLSVGVNEGVRTLVFLYYFHKFGKVTFPEPGSAAHS